MVVDDSRKTTHYSVCPYNCWPTSCGIRVFRFEGSRIQIEGNPHHDVNWGGLCVKGATAAAIPFNPDRLTTPLERVGPRGSGRFEPCGWDRALDRIAGRLRHNIDSGRPQVNALYHSHGNIVQRVNWKLLTPRFANLLGMTLWDGNFPCWYDVGVGQALTGYYGLHDPAEIGSDSAALVNWAQDPMASHANMSRHIVRLLERGGTVVTIDPRVTQTAARSTLHLRPRLGSDVYLANAVAHLLIEWGAVDEDAVRRACHGYEEYAAHVRRTSPKEAARQCEVSLKDIEQLARIYAEQSPLALNLSRGALGKHRGGVQMVRAILCLVPLSGNLARRGGGAVWGEAVELNDEIAAGERRPAAARSYPVNNWNAVDEALESGAVDTLLIVGANPVSQWPALPRLREQLRRVGLIVVNDIFSTTTMREAADIVLPATCWIEELGLRTSNRRVYLMDKVLDPRGECREASDWMRDLAGRLGVRDYFPWADKEACLDACLDGPITAGITVRALRHRPEGMEAALTPVPYGDLEFDTDSGKFELLSNAARRLGLPPLPTPVEPLESRAATPELAARFPLELVSSRRNTHFHTFGDRHQTLPVLRDLEPAPLIQVHPRDALARGLTDGDRAIMFNDRGRARVRIERTTEVRCGQISLNDGWPELNEVTPPAAACPAEVNELLGVGGQPCYQDTLVELRKERT